MEFAVKHISGVGGQVKRHENFGAWNAVIWGKLDE